MNRWLFFACIAFMLGGFFLLIRGSWILRSERVEGEVGFMGKNITGSYTHVYPVIRFRAEDSAYWFNGPDNLVLKEGDKVAVRYSVSDPSDARVDSFVGLWGDMAVYGGIPILLLLFIALHPSIIPFRSRVRFRAAPPFLQIDAISRP